MSRIALLFVMSAAIAFAHCDSLDGPVVTAARRAIAAGDVKFVLPWVPPAQEPAIRNAFQQTLAVRKLDKSAENLADTWFFETVVRVHRAGEGAAYDGLKPAGSATSDAIRSADRAVETGDVSALEGALSAAVRRGLRERYSRVARAKEYKPSDVSAGREYVAAYVDFIHFAERVEQATSAAQHGEAHER